MKHGARWSKDSRWHERCAIIELGEAFGPAGPMVADFLECTARFQDAQGALVSGFTVVSRSCFLDDRALAKTIVEACLDVGVLSGYSTDGREFRAVVASWDADRVVHRPRIPTAVKREVFERDEGTCQYCGTTEDIEYDHIVPFSLGGHDDPNNLQLLCGPCNRRKGARMDGVPTA